MLKTTYHVNKFTIKAVYYSNHEPDEMVIDCNSITMIDTIENKMTTGADGEGFHNMMGGIILLCNNIDIEKYKLINFKPTQIFFVDEKNEIKEFWITGAILNEKNKTLKVILN